MEQKKVAVITGASSEIGLATAKQLLKEGFIVVGLARRINDMQNEMQDVDGSENFHARTCDFALQPDVNEVFRWIESTFKTVHVLVIHLESVKDFPTENLEDVIKRNFLGILNFTEQVMKLMEDQKTYGHIVNVNSVSAHKAGAPPTHNFSLNVHPFSMLSQTLTDQLSKSKIRLTNLNPGAGGVAGNPPVVDAPALRAEDVSSSIVHAISAPLNVETSEMSLGPKSM